MEKGMYTIIITLIVRLDVLKSSLFEFTEVFLIENCDTLIK